jgi:hypothetical protein
MIDWLRGEVVWDGRALLVPAAVPSGQAICRIPRETVHVLRLYSDALGREINLERRNIVEKLAPFLMTKLARANHGEVVELFPWEVDD